MKRTAALIALILLIFAGVLLISDRPDVSVKPATEKPHVSVSTFALYEIVRNVGGDRIEPVMVVPFGTELHSFEPTPRDLVQLTKSRLFVYSGAGLEPWAESFTHEIPKLDVSEHVSLIHLDNDDMAVETEEHHEHDAEHAHHDGDVDPHYWLSPLNMIAATKAIKKELSELFPDYAGEFHRNSEIYITQLHMLDNRFKSELAACKQPMIVVNHNAFGYLAQTYGFEVVALTGLSPESMPSAKRMAELSDLVKTNGLKVIFFESFVSDRLIKEIGQETGANVDTLQPLGNITADEAAGQLSYLQLMERNLAKIKNARECE